MAKVWQFSRSQVDLTGSIFSSGCCNFTRIETCKQNLFYFFYFSNLFTNCIKLHFSFAETYRWRSAGHVCFVQVTFKPKFFLKQPFLAPLNHHIQHFKIWSGGKRKAYLSRTDNHVLPLVHIPQTVLSNYFYDYEYTLFSIQSLPYMQEQVNRTDNPRKRPVCDHQCDMNSGPMR